MFFAKVGQGVFSHCITEYSSTLQGYGAKLHHSGSCLPTRLAGEQCFHGKLTTEQGSDRLPLNDAS